MGKGVEALIKIGLTRMIGACARYVKKQATMKGMHVTDVMDLAGYLSRIENPRSDEVSNIQVSENNQSWLSTLNILRNRDGSAFEHEVFLNDCERPNR